MAYGNGSLIEKYQEQAIGTLSQGELIVRLYDEMIKNLKYASTLFPTNADAAQKCSKKCRNILNYLIVILNGKYDLSTRLGKIYSHMIGQIILTEATGDTSHIDAIVPQLEDLRSAWAEAEKQLRATTGGASPAAARPRP